MKYRLASVFRGASGSEDSALAVCNVVVTYAWHCRIDVAARMCCMEFNRIHVPALAQAWGNGILVSSKKRGATSGAFRSH